MGMSLGFLWNLLDSEMLYIIESNGSHDFNARDHDMRR